MSTELHPKFVELAKLLDEAYDKLHLKAVTIDIDHAVIEKYNTLFLYYEELINNLFKELLLIYKQEEIESLRIHWSTIKNIHLVSQKFLVRRLENITAHFHLLLYFPVEIEKWTQDAKDLNYNIIEDENKNSIAYNSNGDKVGVFEAPSDISIGWLHKV